MAHPLILDFKTKKCIACNDYHVLEKFKYDGKLNNSRCKSCYKAIHRNLRQKEWEDPEYRVLQSERRKARRKEQWPKLYGISYEKAMKIFQEQDFKCANKLCRKDLSFDTGRAAPNQAVLDHDHNTGKFRAILCVRCNMLLGHIENSPDILKGLFEYKEIHKHA